MVILYYPDAQVYDNIETYVDQVDKLFIFDNTPEKDYSSTHPVPQYPNAEYISSGKNRGIGQPLNSIALRSIKEGYRFLLTMDQDSKASMNMVEEYLSFINSQIFDAATGLLCPFVTYLNYPKKNPGTPYSEVEEAFTSGSLLNLSTYQHIGGFNEKYFIDYVDNEYCLRLRKYHFHMYQINTAQCLHQLGNTQTRKLLFMNISITNHQPIRYYYRTRNRLKLLWEYSLHFPLYSLVDLFSFFKELFKIIVYEQQKSQKMRMISFGIRDFVLGKDGEIINS